MLLKRFRNLFIELILLTFIVITITFWLLHIIPGRSGDLSSPMLTPEAKESIRLKYHLNDPVTIQYFIYLKNLFTFNFGVSISIHPDMDITQFIIPKIGISLQLAFIAILISSFLGIIFGVLLAGRPGSWVDKWGMMLISFGISLPAFIIAILLVLLGGQIGLPIIFQKHYIQTWILPIFAYVIPSMFMNIKYVKDSINESMASQYIKFARVKGASRLRILFCHLLKPSLNSTFVRLPIIFAGSMIGGVFVEGIFGIPGMGSMLSSSIIQKDYNVVNFIITLTSFLTILGYFLSEVAQGFLNPVLRYK